MDSISCKFKGFASKENLEDTLDKAIVDRGYGAPAYGGAWIILAARMRLAGKIRAYFSLNEKDQKRMQEYIQFFNMGGLQCASQYTVCLSITPSCEFQGKTTYWRGDTPRILAKTVEGFLLSLKEKAYRQGFGTPILWYPGEEATREFELLNQRHPETGFFRFFDKMLLGLPTRIRSSRLYQHHLDIESKYKHFEDKDALNQLAKVCPLPVNP